MRRIPGNASHLAKENIVEEGGEGERETPIDSFGEIIGQPARFERIVLPAIFTAQEYSRIRRIKIPISPY